MYDIFIGVVTGTILFFTFYLCLPFFARLFALLTRGKVDFDLKFSTEELRWSVILLIQRAPNLQVLSFLNDTIDWFSKKGVTFEILVVDCFNSLEQGNFQRQSDAHSQFQKHVRIIRFRNILKGDGLALHTAIRFARGEKIAVVGLGGGIPISAVEYLENSLKTVQHQSYSGLAIGSRAHVYSNYGGTQFFPSGYVSTASCTATYLYQWCFHLLCPFELHDSQSNFLLMTRNTAQVLFTNFNTTSNAYLSEILYRARKCSIPVTEIAVPWEFEKRSPEYNFLYILDLTRDICAMRLFFAIGLWK